MADHLIVDCSSGTTSATPMTAEEQAERDAAAQQQAERDQVEAAREANRATLEQRATQALMTNATFLALASPSNSDVIAQVRALTRECSAVIRLHLRRLESAD